MVVGKIPASNYTFAFCSTYIDAEERAIMDKLLSYGIKPTGDKATDKARLHKIEYEQAKSDNFISNKYLTITELELQKIQEQKKAKKKIANPEEKKLKKMYEDKIGAQILGQQLYLATKIKSKKDKESKKADYSEKYGSY